MSQPDTPERLLDVAEELFAARGYHATSLRTITATAAVNLAAVHYHFGSKEELLGAVLRRRLVPLNAVRAAALDEVAAAAAQQNRAPEAGAVLRAFIAPTVRFCSGEPGARHFSALVARSMAEPDGTVRAVFLQQIQPLFTQLLGLLRAALPELPAETVFWRLQCSLGATIHVMRVLGQGGLFPQAPPAGDTERLIDELLAFVTAGTRGTP